MKEDNLIQIKSYEFALKIISAYKKLAYEKKEFVMSKQMLRSGTSIGANVEEAIGAQTRRDFAAKIAIAYKEAREVNYWLKILKMSGYLDTETAQNLLLESASLNRILAKIQKTCFTKSFPTINNQ